MARSKVKSRSHHDIAHLLPLTNVSRDDRYKRRAFVNLEMSGDIMHSGGVY